MFLRPFRFGCQFYQRSASATSNVGILKRYEQFENEFPGHVVLMQVGDFYEIYGDAVESAAKILDIAVTRAPTKLSAGDAVAVPMTGFPLRSFDTFLAKLIKAGVSVVVADQVAIQDSARFDRKISRIITPGTLVEENLLDRNRNNFLLLVNGAGLACAWLDVSTGDFFTASCGTENGLVSLLARLKPREILIESKNSHSPALFSFMKRSSIPSRQVQVQLEAIPREQAGKEFTEIEINVSSKLVQYVRDILRRTTLALKPLKRFAPAQHFMSIDADSFKSLDILSSNSAENATLFGTMNECKTALGSRLLARRLQAPLLDPSCINAALDRVEAFTTKVGRESLQTLQRKLEEVGDIERILQRLCLRRPQGVARDLKSLTRSLLASAEAQKMTGKIDDLLSPELRECLSTIPSALVDKPPLRDSEGGIFQSGFNAELDDLRLLRDNSTAVFSDLASSYRQISSVPNLRIVSFKGAQQIVEVPKSVLLPAMFRPLMQTETRARYTTEELLTKSLLLRTISERVIDCELELLGGLLDPILARSDEIRHIAEEVAQIDLESGLAVIAIRRSYTRPRIITEAADHTRLDIIDGRHPVLDKMFSCLDDDKDLLRQFTPNTLKLTTSEKFLLLTGPNMGGKSTFLRQNALIVLMAQCGSFVPATSCSLKPIDAIFTRIGASDDLSRDKSTFMVEMSETAHILRTATSKSLVLIDEIGRGTSAAEGLALASAIARHLIQKNKSWVLFATHYHEIAQSPLLQNIQIQMARTEAEILPDGSVLIIPKVSPGIAKHSYALPVAALAGLPPIVIEDAHSILVQ